MNTDCVDELVDLMERSAPDDPDLAQVYFDHVVFLLISLVKESTLFPLLR